MFLSDGLRDSELKSVDFVDTMHPKVLLQNIARE